MSLLIEKLQPRLVKQFQGIIQNQHLAQGYLFAGAPGTGKKELAQWLALRLFCQNLQAGKPCGQCPECQRIISGNHPDVIQIAPEKQTIKVEAIRYLKNELYKTGMEGAKRVFIIQEAEKMSVNASNSLLKFLEEPASDALIILTTTAKSQILPTIRSRMQIIDFHGIKATAAFERFTALGMTPANAQLLSLLTRDYQQAQTWLVTDSFNQLLKGVLHWFHKVLQADSEAFVLVQTQVVANAKNTADQQLAFEMIINFYDFLLVLRYDKSRTIENSDLNKLVTAAMNLSDQQLMTQLSLVLDIQKQLRVNVSFENVLEALTLKILAV
ncbi:DNA polymerase III subunit delta [Agrilactobacillus composti DSM 18527 = JCM 14202]|uniref:DNA polymerase III subunit delta n=1 Tax=Agrilactobacillus composti DSM 18527 = JCM 14202 TaxID=1423734 RepID=X0QMX0_9LACO|nr:DNA polymerase III subunit delta [Agrilactobacillus composti DSM 18527 = JCM 14202]GAF39945.1 DNA polymerase III delta prime subunit [Agrilactobacillus composti DSM 18527 = JCM 14202]